MNPIGYFLALAESQRMHEEVAAEARYHLIRQKQAARAKGKKKRILSAKSDEIIVRRLRKW